MGEYMTGLVGWWAGGWVSTWVGWLGVTEQIFK